MSAHTIRMSDDELLGEFVPLDSFKGVLEQRLAVSPDLMGMVIRNGEVVSAGAGGNFSMGGVWRSVKDAIVGKHALRLLIADLKPFQAVLGVAAVTRDHVSIKGEVTLDLQINPERPAGVLGMMREHSAVHKSEVQDRIAPHIGDRVFEAVVGQVDAADLRGSTMVQDKIQAEIMKEVDRVAGDLGLLVRAVSLTWAMNADEIAAMNVRDLEREQAQLDAQHQAVKREVERSGEVTALHIQSELNDEKLRLASDHELSAMILNNELTLNDARDTGARVAEMKVLDHEIAKLRTDRLARMEARLDDAANDVEAAKIRAELREVERDIERLDKVQSLELSRLEQFQDLEISQKAREAQTAAIRGLNEAETDNRRAEIENTNLSEDARARRELEAKNADAQAELEKLKAMGNMSPELVLAINAGVSPAAAQVLVEQAKAQSSDTAEKMALMREMIEREAQARESSAEQAKHFHETSMQGVVGVAKGASGGAAPAAGQGSTDGQEVECGNPECRKLIPISARFCRHCGHQMRS